MDVIRQAYDNELIMPGLISYNAFENALKLGKDKCLEKLIIDLERDRLDDIHARMSWWACFNKETKTVSSSDFMDNGFFSDYSNQGTAKPQNNKKNKKKKRKQAKASKKKNRR